MVQDVQCWPFKGPPSAGTTHCPFKCLFLPQHQCHADTLHHTPSPPMTLNLAADCGSPGGPATGTPCPTGSIGRCPPVCQRPAGCRAAPLCLHTAGPAAPEGPVQCAPAAADASHGEAGHVQLGLGEWLCVVGLCMKLFARRELRLSSTLYFLKGSLATEAGGAVHALPLCDAEHLIAWLYMASNDMRPLLMLSWPKP
jgi:hypothetical protein